MAKLYNMAKDCLERGHDIIDTARKEQRPLALFRMATPSPTVSPTLLTHPPGPPLASHLPHPSGPSPSSSHTLPQFARNAPQNLGIRTGPNHTHPHREGVASRNMSWPRGGGQVPGTRSLPRGLEATDGIPGGHVRGAAGGRMQGQQQQQQQLHHSQPNR